MASCCVEGRRLHDLTPAVLSSEGGEEGGLGGGDSELNGEGVREEEGLGDV